MEFLKNTHFDFLGKTRYFLTASSLLVLMSIGVVAAGHLHYGVEFSGGTQVVAKFQKTPEIDKILSLIHI